VDHQRHAAVRTIDRAGALPAEHRGREPAPVEQHQRLLAAFQARPDCVHERAAQDHVRTGRGEFLAHVDDHHRGQWTTEDPALQDDPLVLAAHRAVVALHRRRRRPEHHQRTGLLAAHNRKIASVVSRALVLLVRGIVLLVYDNQAELRQRREDGGPRPDDRVDVAAADPLPLVVALAGREAAVLNSNPVAEAVTKRGTHGGGEGNFRHKHQDAAAQAAHVGGEAEVDLGFPAAGDAVQERDAELSGGSHGLQALEGVGLIGSELAL
jgi:hypothetical protein